MFCSVPFQIATFRVKMIVSGNNYRMYCLFVSAPLKLRPYGAIRICLLLLLLLVVVTI